MKLIQVSLNRTPGDFTLGGNLLFDVTNSRDVGSTASKPQNVYAGTALLSPLLQLGTATFLQEDTADILAQRHAANPQGLRIYNKFVNSGDYERFAVNWVSNALTFLSEAAGSGTERTLTVGAGASGGRIAVSPGGAVTISRQNVADHWIFQAAGPLITATDNLYSIGLTGASRPSSLFLGAPAITPGAGTGYTAVNSGEVRRLNSKHTLTFAALSAAATTADFTLCTLPAKTRLVGVVMDVTTPFTGGTVASATLQFGKSVGGTEYLVAKDAFTAPATYGLADADLGASLNRANAVQGGDLPSWTATTTLSVRLTVGGDTANHTTAGSVTFSIITEVSP